MPKYCGNCGTKNKSSSVFCGECGNSLIYEKQLRPNEVSNYNEIFCQYCGSKIPNNVSKC